MRTIYLLQTFAILLLPRHKWKGHAIFVEIACGMWINLRKTFWGEKKCPPFCFFLFEFLKSVRKLQMSLNCCKMKRHGHKNRNCILGILTSSIRWWKWSAIYIAYDNKKLEAHRHCHLRLWLFKYWYLTRFFFVPFSSLHISLNQKSLLMAYYCACIIQWWKIFFLFFSL
jgi:hypothetical protein